MFKSSGTLRLFFTGMVIYLLMACQHSEKNVAEEPFNFVVIVVDDLGFNDLQANKYDSFYQTPNLNSFAESATNFSNNYAANPVCSPTRLALLTGQHPSRLNATDWFHHHNKQPRQGRFLAADSRHEMPLEAITVAERLPEQYQTTFIGKWHLGEKPELWPEHQGFDTNIAGFAAGHPRGGFFSPYKNPRLDDGPKGEYLTERLSTEAINTLNSYDKDQPFLLMLSYYSVHVPLQAPKHTVEKYQALARALPDSTEFMQEEQIWPNTDDKRQTRIRQSHPVYAAMVESLDTQIGRVLDHIDTLGLRDNTVVLITSDNGGLSTAEGSPTSNYPLRAGKGWVYEGGIKVPLLARFPQLPQQPKQVFTPTVSMDLPATILHLAGHGETAQDGQSLIQLMQPTTEQRALFWHYPHYSNQGGIPAAAVRVGQYKLIQRLETGELALFDLNDDPSETTDLAAQFPEVTTRLSTLLNDWYRDVDAQFLRAKDKQQPWHPEQ